MQQKIGLVIGRFQPFHKGHLYLIKSALQEVNEVVICIGSVNVHDENNPFSFEERKKSITEALKKYRLTDAVRSIIGINDDPSDEKWLQETLRKSGPVNIVFGNNEWVNGIFERAGYKVKRIPYYKRDIYEGTKIRKEMKATNNPQKVLEKYVP